MDHDPIPVNILSDRFLKARGVSFEPSKMVAAELRNITDVLMELLKEARRLKP